LKNDRGKEPRRLVAGSSKIAEFHDRLIIFDMDGVIIKTSHLHEAAWHSIAKKYGYPWNQQLNFAKDVFGTASPDSARILFPGYISHDAMPQICQEKAHIYEQILREQILNNIEVPGFRSFFDAICEAGIPVALATSSPKSEANFVLDRLGVLEKFNAVIDVSQVSKPKPDPEIYLTAAATVGFAPEECLGVEDSLTGIEAINQAKMKCVVVGTTLTQERLSRTSLRYDLYIPDFQLVSLGELSLLFSLLKGDNQ